MKFLFFLLILCVQTQDFVPPLGKGGPPPPGKGGPPPPPPPGKGGPPPPGKGNRPPPPFFDGPPPPPPGKGNRPPPPFFDGPRPPAHSKRSYSMDTCLSNPRSAANICKNDVAKFCTVPSGAKKEWLKRCIHDYWRDNFKLDCLEAIGIGWDKIKKEKKLNSDSSPMASDIYRIVTCKYGKYGKYGKRGRRERFKEATDGFDKLLILLIIGFVLACCPGLICYKYHKSRTKISPKRSRPVSPTARDINYVGNQKSNPTIQQTSIRPIYPIITSESPVQGITNNTSNSNTFV